MCSPFRRGEHARLGDLSAACAKFTDPCLTEAVRAFWGGIRDIRDRRYREGTLTRLGRVDVVSWRKYPLYNYRFVASLICTNLVICWDVSESV